jgi:hypothetical protein
VTSKKANHKAFTFHRISAVRTSSMALRPSRIFTQDTVLRSAASDKMTPIRRDEASIEMRQKECREEYETWLAACNTPKTIHVTTPRK